MTASIVPPYARQVSLKLWVDDERQAPDGFAWVWTSSAAIELLKRGVVGEMSLDHDLGIWGTTRPIVLWMCENDAWPEIVRVHSQNNVGRTWLEGMVRHYAPDGTLRHW